MGNNDLIGNLLHELGFQSHSANAGDFAIDIVTVGGIEYESDRLDLGADLHHATPKFEILDHVNGVTIYEFIAVGIAYNLDIC